MASHNKKCSEMDQNLLKWLQIKSWSYGRQEKVEPVERLVKKMKWWKNHRKIPKLSENSKSELDDKTCSKMDQKLAKITPNKFLKSWKKG